MNSPWKDLGNGAGITLSHNGEYFVVRQKIEVDGNPEFDTVALTMDEAEALHSYLSAFFPRVKNGRKPLQLFTDEGTDEA